MTRKLPAACILVPCLAVSASQPAPSRILSGYNGIWLDRSSIPQFVNDFLDPLHAAGFTACGLKIHPANIDLTAPEQLRRLREISHAIHERDMLFLAYVYPHPHHGHRDPVQDASLPPFVRADGTAVEDRFSLIHWPTWRKLFDNTLQLAQASNELPITAVRVDIETIANSGISYDDQAWARFAADAQLSPGVAAPDRAGLLREKQLFDRYAQWFKDQLNAIAQRYEREMHALNPELMLGYMPAYPGWFYDPFTRHLATERAPAVIDNWTMYNGEGFNEKVLAEQTRVKAMNPHNLSIPWFRVNSYRPDDIAVQAYHAGFATDGYSNWTMGMLGPDHKALPSGYQLPQPYTPSDYYAAYRRANTQLRADLAAGKTEPLGIPFRPVTPLSPPLTLDNVRVPQLQPAGDGTGEPQWLVLRDQRVIYVHARAGESIEVDVRHVAGDSRPVALQYAVIDAQHTKLRNESVMPGATESFTCTAPETATYALVVTGGEGGQAWYGVRVHNQHMGVLAEPAYFFYTGTFSVWVSRSHPTNPARVKVHTPKSQLFTAAFNNAPAIEGNEVTFDLPRNRAAAVLVLGKPAEVPAGIYTQDFNISVEGAAEPYLADGPERRLVTPGP